MALPTADAYNDAIQTPRLAFPDPVLASGTVECNGFGLPKALSGGFAITYHVTNSTRRAFAVRCFHKEVHDLQDRYRIIHNGLKAARLSPFVEFEYQQTGIRVQGSAFPIVRMEWVEGITLGEYLEHRHRDRQAMERLRLQFANLEEELASKGVAHGDLQNGNVLVDRSGLRLVDYDGMFVAGMPLGRGAELGHKHFQHPLRRGVDFGPDIDRFSFIVIDTTLWALSIRPDLFKQFSTGENILFSANDFADPDSSRVFQTLMQVGDPPFKQSVAALATVCKADFKAVPRLREFARRTAIPKPTSKPLVLAPDVAAYIAPLPVVDAGSFEAICKHVGDRVEMVGQVVEVKMGSTRKGTPYVFINFRDWRDKCVRATIWSEGLKALGYTPDATWIGQWLVINGMIDPVYHGKDRYKTIQYVSVGPTVTDLCQIHKVSKEEALWRLGKGPRTGAVAKADETLAEKRQSEILTAFGGAANAPTEQPPVSPNAATPRASAKSTGGVPSAPKTTTRESYVKTRNEQIFTEISASTRSSPSSGTSGTGPDQKPEPKGCATWAAMILAAFLTIFGYILVNIR